MVVFSGIQDKGVSVTMTVDTRADLEKAAEVVSEPTLYIETRRGYTPKGPPLTPQRGEAAAQENGYQLIQ